MLLIRFAAITIIYRIVVKKYRNRADFCREKENEATSSRLLKLLLHFFYNAHNDEIVKNNIQIT